MKNAMFYARQVIKYCHENNHDITNLQLQKILYFLQAQNLRLYNEPLFEDDFEAFKYGAIIYEVYNNYSRYGAHAIADDITDRLELSYKQKSLIENCMNLAAFKLVDINTQVGGAWYKTFRNGVGIGNIIDKKLISLEATTA
ncbi:DUF4065 domain-containing protein [Campylobacter sp. RM12640]|uniref:Panacea domain-containing protein n=1 Tax=unclassified Campylobacter TaxID=2593542 RepID=UPI001D6823C9|nr:DUF4065 domain-containing protein [Campylobacter sp. RM12640]MBZ7989699.1 DUF4065 domain-containing protein [Campylobacter sp. RM12635]MBZ7991757.1 DUF4065 domain-containing protein [Campylobacter sp. RM9331]MBZ8005189.1 DUF4065 domain-containing protein [Campylobacter sp. RM9332]